jgi:hypothetical protein
MARALRVRAPRYEAPERRSNVDDAMTERINNLRAPAMFAVGNCENPVTGRLTRAVDK